MKTFSGSIIILLSILLFTGCKGKGSMKKDLQTGNDTISVPDTGYTGIKKYMSGKYIVKEVTFKNGVKEGLMKSFYQDGRVRQTFWYKNDLKEDSSKFYYQEGQLFRTTPYKRDTIDGIQIQYYRTGKLKAKIGYSKGLRTPYLEEFTQEGKLIGNYPGLVVNIKDEYRDKGIYRISLGLSDMTMSENVKYYRGDLSQGVFDTVNCKVIKTIKGVGYLDLRKTGSQKTGSLGVIASIVTNFGNRHLIYKKIELPYNDLN